jgi:hypothetical protein
MRAEFLYRRCIRVLWKHFGKQVAREKIALHLVACPERERGWLVLVHSSWWTHTDKAWRWSKTVETAEELLEALDRYAVPIVRSCLAIGRTRANGHELRSNLQWPRSAQHYKGTERPFLS